MPVFRFYDQLPQFFTRDGLPLAGGSITFYDNGTTVPKNTWSDPGKTVLNANPVSLDSTGRSSTDIWLDGTYTVVLKDSGSVIQWTLDDFRLTEDAGLVIPALVSGQFLTNDGTNLLWNAIRQVPDPTGSNGFFLSTDGANLLWQEIIIPTPPEPEVIVTATTFQAGTSDNTNKYFTQAGSDVAPATGTNQTQQDVVFPTAFAVTPIVVPIPTTTSSGGGYMPIPGVIAKSPTGFTVKFESNAGTVTSGRIVNNVPFDWIAFGRLVVP